MAKLLPVASVVGAVVAGLCIWLVSGDAVGLIVLLVAVFGGVAAILERGLPAILTGAALIALGALSFLFFSGSIGGEGGGLDFNSMDRNFRVFVFPPLVLLAVAGSLLLRWNTLQPSWAGFALVGGLVLTAVLLFVFQADVGQPASMAALPGVVALLCAVPGVMALRAPAAEAPPEPAAAPTPTRKPTKRKA